MTLDALPVPDEAAQAHSGRLLALLLDDIAANGPMPFARFMERCLYAPGLGYYSAGSAKFGSSGDFVTAPETGDVFARCVANHVRPVIAQLDGDGEILELGGGSGVLAVDLLQALARVDSLPSRYLILEPGADLRDRQKRHIDGALPAAIAKRVTWIDRPPTEPWRGVLLANEVIDALPTTRFAIDHGNVMEEHVTVSDDGALAIVDHPADDFTRQAVRHVEQGLGHQFEHGHRSEILPQLPWWLDAVAGTMTAGAAMFVDYGHPRADYYAPSRNTGTLRAYYRHHAHRDPFFWPGLQDLTASVDFTALAEAGQHAGFDVAAYMPQAQWLIAGNLQQAFAEASAETTDDIGRYKLAQQVKQLTLPEAMGESFQAMVLTRDLPMDGLLPELLTQDRSNRL